MKRKNKEIKQAGDTLSEMHKVTGSIYRISKKGEDIDLTIHLKLYKQEIPKVNPKLKKLFEEFK